MKNPLKTAVKAVAAAVSGKPASETAAERLLEARKDRDEKAAHLANLNGDRETAFRRLDRERVQELDAEISALETDIGFANQAVANLEAEEREALDREEDERKRQAFDAARQKLEAGEKYLRKHWGEYGRGLRLMLRTVAEGDLLAKQVNANLPAGAEPLKTLEERLLRSHLAREDLESVELELWIGKHDQAIVPAERQAAVVDEGNGTGLLPSSDGRGSGKSVVKRRFRRTTYLPAASGSLYDGFARTLNVPGLAYEPPLFTPAPSDDPNAVLEHIEHLEAYEREFSSQRKPRTELVPVEAELPAAAE